MRITLAKDAVCGSAYIPSGEYMVALGANSEMVLTGGGRQYKLPAVKRRQNSKSKTTNVMFYCGGGPLWSIVVSTPKHGEWVCMIEYDMSGSKKPSEKK